MMGEHFSHFTSLIVKVPSFNSGGAGVFSSNLKEDYSMKKRFSKKGRSMRRLGFIFVPVVGAVAACALLFSSIFGGAVYARGDLMKGITPAKVKAVKLSDDFVKSTADFSMELFKKSVADGKNSLISPVSIYLALAMTGNGADGKTLEEFQSVLGRYNLTMDDINRFCFSFASSLANVKSGKLNIANSIWYRDDGSLNVSKNFLQTNADYFGSSAYKADFNSSGTVRDINRWVKSNTNNLIDKIVDKIDPSTAMYLINTLYFEADWQNQYGKGDKKRGV
jgi:serpin B